MSENNSFEISNENNENNIDKREIIIGSVEIFVGCVAINGAYSGITEHEAAEPEDALGSVNLGDSSAFVMPIDLGFAVLGAAGLAIVGRGVHRIWRSR